MAPIDSVFFGTPPNIDRSSIAFNTEQQDLQDGLSIAHHIKTLTLSLSKEGTLCDAYGIAASDDTTRNNTGMIIESISYSQTEKVSDPCMETHPDYLNSGAYSAPDYSKVLQYYDQHLYLGVEETIRASLRWRGRAVLAGNTLALEMIKAGDHVTQELIVGPAAYGGSVPAAQTTMAQYYAASAPTWPFIHIGATANRTEQFYVRSAEFSQEEEWHKCDIELYRVLGVVNATDTVNSPLKNKLLLFGSPPPSTEWEPNASWLGLDISPITMYRISINFSLSQGQNATLSETIEVFPTDPDDPMLSLT